MLLNERLWTFGFFLFFFIFSPSNNREAVECMQVANAVALQKKKKSLIKKKKKRTAKKKMEVRRKAPRLFASNEMKRKVRRSRAQKCFCAGVK